MVLCLSVCLSVCLPVSVSVTHGVLSKSVDGLSCWFGTKAFRDIIILHCVERKQLDAVARVHLRQLILVAKLTIVINKQTTT